MKSTRSAICAVVGTILAVCCSCTRTHTADPAPRAPSVPAGAADFFPITPWETPWSKQAITADPKIGIASLRDCGYNTAAFVTADQVPLCEKLGIRAIVALPKGPAKWREMSDEQIEQTVKELVGNTGGNDAVLGYFLMDEPGVQYFAALGKAVAAVKKLAPGKLAYINLFPNYATLGAPDLSQLGTPSYTEYLERYVNEVKPQFVSYDNYQTQMSQDFSDRAKVNLYFRNLLEVRRVAQKHNLPFWNIVSSNQIRPHTTVPSPANLAVQAYTTLAAGGRGLTWYTYYAKRYGYAPIDDEGHRTATWTYLKMINEQVKVLGPIISRLRSTGVYLTDPPDKSLPKLPGEVVEAVTSPTPTMVGEFAAVDGTAYVMVVNLGLERSSLIRLKTRTAYQRPMVISPADGSLSKFDQQAGIWLPAGQGALIRFE